MIDLVGEAELNLLSYHCHSLVPVSVSCVGVLLESHVSFHTFPEEGCILLDLFTCGSKPLVPIVGVIEKLFAIPSPTDDEKPRMLWSHRLRGYREDFSPSYDPHQNPLEQDLGHDMYKDHDLDLKESLVSVQTDYQHVDIVKLVDPTVPVLAWSLASYERSMSNDGSFESENPQFFSADKELYLDGVLQSSLIGEAAYHEALVHPSMITHPDPKRVAIIGGGEGATLREVLKHKSVEEVVMVEIDEELVELCKTFLPEWSDCSDVEGRDAKSCFDDSRAKVVFIDAFQWFIDTFGDGAKAEKFDVIIMDALDPDKMISIVGSLYKNDQFMDSLFNGLSKEGVVSSSTTLRPYIGTKTRSELLYYVSCLHSSSSSLAREILNTILRRIQARIKIQYT